jgi:hypothetical protein
MGYNLKGTVAWMETQWHIRLVQISVFSALIFWLLSSYKLVDGVNKYIERIFKVKFGASGTRILHAFIFGFIQFVMIKYILDPFAKVMDGTNMIIEGLTPNCITDLSTCLGRASGDVESNRCIEQHNQCTGRTDQARGHVTVGEVVEEVEEVMEEVMAGH